MSPAEPSHLQRAVRAPPAARARRHGRGVPGARPVARPAGGGQGAVPGAGHRRRASSSASAARHRRPPTCSTPTSCSVFDWGEANGTYFIVMEYVEGHTLAEILRDEGRLHPDRAAEITADIAAALGFAHRNGVVHRDVKPGNVLITRRRRRSRWPTSASPGPSATRLDQNLTKTGSVMGTATYFSPEQARGAPVDPRSDLYSLGVRALRDDHRAGPPFTGDSAVAIAYKHVQENPVPPRRIDPALPETLEAITLKCLAKNPANRYPTAQDLRADLRRYLDGSRILAEPVLAPPIDPGRHQRDGPTGTATRPPWWPGRSAYDGSGRLRRVRRLRRLARGRGAQAVQVVPGGAHPAAAHPRRAAVPAGAQLRGQRRRPDPRSPCRMSSASPPTRRRRRSRPRASSVTTCDRALCRGATRRSSSRTRGRQRAGRRGVEVTSRSAPAPRRRRCPTSSACTVDEASGSSSKPGSSRASGPRRTPTSSRTSSSARPAPPAPTPPSTPP